MCVRRFAPAGTYFFTIFPPLIVGGGAGWGRNRTYHSDFIVSIKSEVTQSFLFFEELSNAQSQAVLAIWFIPQNGLDFIQQIIAQYFDRICCP